MTQSALQKLKGLLKGMLFKHVPYMISCVEFDDFISMYFEGSLPGTQVRVFELHLKVCRECRDYLAAYQEAMEVGRIVFNEPDASVPDDVPEDLVKAILDARTR